MSTSQVEEVQLRALDMFASYCESHQLQYFLAYGSLLGAVRHGGFIPWDDDVDVMMPRSDFERFCAIAAAEMSASGLRLDSLRTRPKWSFPYAKLGDIRTVAEENVRARDRLSVGIDIFPVDSLPSGRGRALVSASILTVLRKVYFARLTGRREGRPLIKRAMYPFIRVSLSPLSLNTIARLWTKVARSVSERDQGGARYAVLVGFSPWSVRYHDLHPAVPIGFEGRYLAGPNRPATVLAELYGDFMKLPPVEHRVPPHGCTYSWV